ncbi:hypothetical protein [Streptomyces sp. NBC_00576]|uniref:hypothetical protein n=1 Tax=Streptomyces sp. NBC_00576 TaxID=2903665 RepID=UPI002E7FD187|nr:hypothetical protein [Streptomyces sp. NBC_00576]WUB77672.1 hypothetical protein OG734_47735 [Streptomyces sp. NBC_00576]
MTTLLNVTLTPDQRSLLTTIAQPWIETGEWPLWANVQHEFDMRGQDADAVFHSLPRVGNEAPFASGYGYTIPMRAPIDPGHKVRLTVAGASRLPKGRMATGEPFMHTLRHMIDLYISRPILADEVPSIILRSGELTTALPNLEPWFVKALPDLLSYEPAISTGGANLGDGSWEREVTRSVMQFRGMHTVEEYIEKTCEIVVANAAQYAPVFVEEETMTAEPSRGPYVDVDLMAELETAAATTRWKVHKLIALCEGLNDAYIAGNPYACAAMLRAILDHIPPVFEHTDFKHVAAQHVFSMKRNDKTHAQRLAAFKDIADDVMHRAIGHTVPRIRMDDLPEPIRLNAVLNEVLVMLPKTAPPTA